MYEWTADSEGISLLERQLASASAKQVEKYLRTEIQNLVTEMRSAYDMGDEEIFDKITEFHDGKMTEYEIQTLAELLGIA